MRKWRVIVTTLIVNVSAAVSSASMASGLPAVPLRIGAMKCEMTVDPLGVDLHNPRMTWTLQSSLRGQASTAYQILVASSPLALTNDRGDCWDSGKVIAHEIIGATYAGVPLHSFQQVFWKVRAWDHTGQVSEWSSPATWTMGLLEATDWKAKWISEASDAASTKPDVRALPIFRRSFMVNRPVRRATVSVCGLGQFELRLNGEKVGENVMEPGWTDYRKTCLYVTYDVTSQLHAGENVIAAMLGNGMYHLPPITKRYQKFTGSFGSPAVIAQLQIEHADGSLETLSTDRSWKSTAGPIMFSSIYGGEDFDARRLPAGWDRAGFDEAAWQYSVEVAGPGGLLAGLSRSAPSICVADIFQAQSVSQPRRGVYVYDFGQNASVMPRITVSGSDGATVKLLPGELLNADGTVSQQSSGGPAWFTYTLRGLPREIWSPRFTYYGSRYVQVEGAVPATAPNPSGLPVIQALEAQFITSASASAGAFSCSNDLFNRTATIIRWAMRSNMQSILTDCPHRERLGWLEQCHLVGPSLMDNFDVHSLFHKICGDMADAQTREGLIPDIAPELTTFSGGFRDSPEWGSACVLIPWQMYQWYGDDGVLRSQYETMKRYVAYLGDKATGHILSYGLGDWYDLGPRHPGPAQLTPVSLTATAFYYRDLTLLEKIARLIGRNDDAEHDAALARDVADAFNQKHFNRDAQRYATGSQTSNAIPLVFGLVPQEARSAVLDHLVADIRARGNALTAGDIGYRYVLRALADAGRSDVIFDMNSRSDRPGYGYILARGATSLTEGWDGTSSQNHFMLGHIIEWFYSDLAGIQQAADSVAFNKIIIRPMPVGDVTWAKASYDSVRGKIASEWQMVDGKLTLEVEIPVGATATVYLPVKQLLDATEAGVPLNQANGVVVSSGDHALHLASGKYRFQAVMN